MSKQALDGSRINAFLMDADKLTIVTDDKHHLYDERINLPLSDGLVKNIRKFGVKVPVIVAKEGDKILVVEGRQRVRAVIEINKDLKSSGEELLRIPCMVERGTEADLFSTTILCNENRQDDSPMAKAEKCKRLMDRGRTAEEAAVVFGVTVTCIGQWMKLLELSAPVRKAVDDGKVTATAASKLHGLEPEKQKKALEKALESSAGKKRASGKAVAKAVKGDAGIVPPTKSEITKLAHDEKLHIDFRQLLQWVVGELGAADVAHIIEA